MATPCPVLGGLLDTLYLKLDKKLEICTSKEIPDNVMALASGEAYDWEEDALREALVAQCDDLLADLAKAKEARDDAQMEEDAKEEEDEKKKAEERNRKKQQAQKEKEEEKQRKKAAAEKKKTEEKKKKVAEEKSGKNDEVKRKVCVYYRR